MSDLGETAPEPKRLGYQQSEWWYSPLALDPPEVRLLTLKPGSGESLIVCEVYVYDFDEKLHQIYEALSYTWEGASQAITVNGNSEFEVTGNLSVALRRIRHETQSRLLWVDAICINQKDKVEKSQQLGKIGDIYKHCKNCIIWLGDLPEGVNPSHARELLDSLATCAPDSQGSKHFSKIDAQDPQDPNKRLNCFKHDQETNRTDVSSEFVAHFEALNALLALSWWKRTWTIQELALPAKVQLLYATFELPYETLKNSVRGLIHHLYSNCCKEFRLRLLGLGFDSFLTVEEKLDPMVFTREKRMEKEPVTFSQLRKRFCGSEVSWKRDFFYGFLGIAADGTFLQPSYTIPLRTAITEATFGCIKNEKGGVELLLGERLFRSRDRYTRLHMPSWVSDGCFCTFPPRWAMMERRRLNIYSSFASSAVTPTLQQQLVGDLAMSKNGILITGSWRVGKINGVGSVFDDSDNWYGGPLIIQQWMGMAGIEPTSWPEEPPKKGNVMDVFWRTMINDSREADEKHLSYQRLAGDGEADYQILQGMLKELKREMEAGNAESLRLSSHNAVVSKYPEITYHLLTCLWRRRLFITEDERIGLAPEDAEKGDEIHIIPGCPAPFILRSLEVPNGFGLLGDRDTDKLPQYMVIGNGFFHGFMGGEMPKSKEDEGKENGGDKTDTMGLRKIAIH